VTSPANPSSPLANPNGSLPIVGTATANSGSTISAVTVAVQSGGADGPWWDQATGEWNAGFVDNPATLVHPGAASTDWALSVPIPAEGGTYTVQASAVNSSEQADISAYQGSPVASRSSFTVGESPTAPVLSTPDGEYVAPGASIEAKGSGYTSGETVNLSVAGTTLAKATASGSGSFDVPVPIPANMAFAAGSTQFGVASLVATGQTSASTSSTPIDILNNWTSAADGGLHQAYEPNDETWNNHIVGNPDRFVTQAWGYPSGAPIRTSPAVVDDVAYTANTAGTVTALDVRNSEPLWTQSLGSAVYSSPAVSGNLVVMGTEAHTVDALNTSTGDVVWSTTTSSAVESSPNIVGSTVYVGSDDGTVYALDLSTGQVQWQVTLGGAVMSSPTVDAANNEVVVTDMSGEVTALNATTGDMEWASQKVGPISATPMIDNGQIYVGSQDDNVYDFNESTGAEVWSYTTTGPITGQGADWNGTNYVVGNNASEIVFLNLKTGALLRNLTETGEVTGVTSAQGFVVMSFSNGDVIANKFPNETNWTYFGTGLVQPVTLANGVAYVAGQDGALRAFTIPGTTIP
jgi:outer membrane protein assembly factor BamB